MPLSGVMSPNEAMRTGPCASAEEVTRFYQRQGGFLALLYALGATVDHGTTVRSSTSAATAVVSGLLALMMSAGLRRGVSIDAQGAKDVLLRTAAQVFHDLANGWRNLDAETS